MKIRLILIVAALITVPIAAVLTANPSAAQAADLVVEGQYRARLVLDSDLDFVGPEAVERELVSHRARLRVRYGTKEKANLVLSLQDVRVWGEEGSPITRSTGSLAVHEAYLLIPLTKIFHLTFGRQPIRLDHGRLVGFNDFLQRGTAFDAVRFELKRPIYDVNLFYALVSETDATDPDGNVPPARFGDIGFGAFHVGVHLPRHHRVSAMWVARADQSQRDFRHTFGAVGAGSVLGAGYTAEFYYQAGHTGPDDVSAFLAALRLGYQFGFEWAPTLIVWADYLSGDGSAAGAFDPLFGEVHNFYGRMDVFPNVVVDTVALGLIDYGFRAQITPNRFIDVQLDYHFFQTAHGGPQGETALGNELDVRVRFAMQKAASATLLYGVFVPDEALAAVRGIPPDGVKTEHRALVTTDIQF